MAEAVSLKRASPRATGDYLKKRLLRTYWEPKEAKRHSLHGALRMSRTSPVEMKLAGSRQEWDQWVRQAMACDFFGSPRLLRLHGSKSCWLLVGAALRASSILMPGAGRALGVLEVADEQQGIALPSEYKVGTVSVGLSWR